MQFNNPIPRSGLPKFHEASQLKSQRDSDVVPKLWQKNRTLTQQTLANSQAIEQAQRQLNRLRRRGGSADEGEQGWHWAEPKEYDWITKSYSPNEIVILSPSNPACLVTGGVNTAANAAHGILTGKDGTPHTGALTSTDVATAGKWVCIRPPNVLSASQPASPTAPRNYDIHVPRWPLPNEDLTIDTPSAGVKVTYWELVSFIPIERTWCNKETNSPEQFYVQAVMIPEPPVPPP